jgi:iron complex transport system permease protein
MSGYRLILVGIGVAAALQAVTSYLLIRANLEEVQEATVWLTGSLNGSAWETTMPLLIAVVVLVPATLLLARSLRGLQLGDDSARGLGVRVEPMRAAIVLAGVGLVGFGTAAAGPVAFVALISAPIARRLVGPGRLALLAAGLAGALLLTLSDVIARQAFGEVELPVGVITGILGAPYLLWLLVHTNRRGTGD